MTESNGYHQSTVLRLNDYGKHLVAAYVNFVHLQFLIRILKSVNFFYEPPEVRKELKATL